MPVFYFFAFLLLIPAVTHAQTFQNLLRGFIGFVDSILIPFLIGIAFLFFVINVIRYFVLGSTNEDGREKAKALAIYGVFAFVLMIILWGVVNMIATSIGLQGATPPTPDYIEEKALTNPGCGSGETSVCYDSFGVTVCRCE